jgi:hypothetical protein
MPQEFNAKARRGEDAKWQWKKPPPSSASKDVVQNRSNLCVFALKSSG